jgi:hypothetical protein
VRLPEGLALAELRIEDHSSAPFNVGNGHKDSEEVGAMCDFEYVKPTGYRNRYHLKDGRSFHGRWMGYEEVKRASTLTLEKVRRPDNTKIRTLNGSFMNYEFLYHTVEAKETQLIALPQIKP